MKRRMQRYEMEEVHGIPSRSTPYLKIMVEIRPLQQHDPLPVATLNSPSQPSINHEEQATDWLAHVLEITPAHRDSIILAVPDGRGTFIDGSRCLPIR